MKTEYRTKCTYFDITETSAVVLELKNYPVENLLLVYDANIKNSAIDDLITGLNSEFSVKFVFRHDGKEPTTTIVDSLRKDLSSADLDTVIGIGGGSTLDLAKAMSVLHFYNKPAKEAQGVQISLTRKLFSVAIPTTAGSGSEATKSAVLTNTEARIKRGINHLMVLPEVAFLYPALLEGIPKSVFVASIFDGFTHALESYIGQLGNENTKSLSEKAIKIYMEQFELLKDNRELKIHSQILTASNLAGTAICNSETGPVHALSYPLSEYYALGHGQAVGLLLPKVLRTYEKSDDSLKLQIEDVTKKTFSELISLLESVYATFVTRDASEVQNIDIAKVSSRSMELSGAIKNCPINWTVENSIETLKLIWH
jgi:alcohol dehydrogenase class IV